MLAAASSTFYATNGHSFGYSGFQVSTESPLDGRFVFVHFCIKVPLIFFMNNSNKLIIYSSHVGSYSVFGTKVAVIVMLTQAAQKLKQHRQSHVVPVLSAQTLVAKARGVKGKLLLLTCVRSNNFLDY